MKRATAIGWLKHDVTNRGITAWLLSGFFLGFYVLLYFGYNIKLMYGVMVQNKLFVFDYMDKGMIGIKGVGHSGYIKVTQAFFEQQSMVRIGWPMAHMILFALLLVGIVFFGTRAYLSRREAGGEGASSAIVFTVASLLLTVAMFVLPDIYYALGFYGEPFSEFSKAIGLPDKWLLYGLIYSICIGTGGAYVIWKYRHNRYQIVRTSVVIFVQIVFGFSIPWILKMFQQPDYYFSYIWPLKTSYFYPSTVAYQFKAGLPVPIIAYSFVAGLIIAPLMGIFFGKRWYCSWVCGCGGLANTFGEPWRHLSDKSSTSWKLEKFTIHFALGMTLLVTGIAILSGYLPKASGLQAFDSELRGLYGIIFVSVLSGIIGVGLYPLGGTRVWCRFGCPMAALLGLLQKFGRFRIRVKRDMCISCGLCSKYCEMGIDVRSYAQANQSFTRASCVGCGICSEVCPRGVLRLENISRKDPQEIDNSTHIKESWKGDDFTINARD